MKSQISFLRENLLIVSKKVLKNERTRKKIIVKLYNIQTICHIKSKDKTASFFELEKMISNKFYLCKEDYKGNFLYGIADILKQFSNYENKINACIEHGVYFGSYVNDMESKKSGFPAVITFSNNRKKHIQKVSDKMVFAVGPYIYYAKGFLDQNEINKLKLEFGKTLLVFPSHSVDRIQTKFNYDGLIEQIKKYKNAYDFNTVLICLYYRDIELGRAELYQNCGYKVVSAGRREDPHFLNRLRSIILLSDYTISNNVGTHIGYSIVLNKPHTVINQETDYVADSKVDIRHVTTLYLDSAIDEKQEVASVFSTYSDFITPEQIEICNKYWGLNLLKDSQEMRFILQFCEDVYIKASKKEKHFNETARESVTNILGTLRDIISDSLL